MTLSTVAQYAKAIVGGVGAGIAAYVPAASDGQVTSGEWWTVVVAVLAGAGVIAAVPNKPKPGPSAAHPAAAAVIYDPPTPSQK
jgi:hypothetical protein